MRLKLNYRHSSPRVITQPRFVYDGFDGFSAVQPKRYVTTRLCEFYFPVALSTQPKFLKDIWKYDKKDFLTHAIAALTKTKPLTRLEIKYLISLPLTRYKDKDI